ncbi:lactate-responsive regulator LldR [Rothia aeria]|uniref:Lactate-responsive regulator LldR n=1 Tax=Rothia aeria TaxID=172042 RepID=A0A2Z5QXT7_9MICC|nr:lactate-responsive regulator LldR [Rothia aeria]
MAIHRKILRWLENELTEGNLQLGQDLPDDQRIARAIGLGRSRTREGLKTLEDMDLVRLYSGKGKEIIAHLNEEPAMAAAEPLRLHMAVSRYPKRDLVQTHMLLEGWSVANIDPGVADFGEVDELLEEMQEGGHPIREFLDLYLDFHLELSRLANNELIAGLLIAIRQPTFDALLSLAGRVPLWSSTMERLNAENRAVLEAVKDADSATARNLMMNQMRGLFDEAGVDLDESAVALTGMPGTSDLRMFEPVDIEDDFGPFPEEGPSFGWGFGAERFGNAPGGAPVPSSGSQQARRDTSQQSQQHYDGQQGQQEQQSNLPLSFGTASGRAAAAFTRPSEGAPAAQTGNNGASQPPRTHPGNRMRLIMLPLHRRLTSQCSTALCRVVRSRAQLSLHPPRRC